MNGITAEKNKKKLVILSAFYEPYMSGAEQMAKEIAERLRNKYNITLITGRYNWKLKKTEKRSNFKLLRVGLGYKKIDKLLYPFLAAWQAKRIKPQIVHAIMESYAGGALFLLKYFYPPSKRILTLQSGDLDDTKKQKKFFIKLFWKKIHISPDKITAISSFLSKRALKLGVNKEKISITPNGIDFSEVPKNIKKEKNRVICVGRLSWEKGHKYILEAWGKVLKKFPDAKLYFVGEGLERKNIEQKIKNLQLKNSVILTGNLPHKQVLEEISKAEVFVCPSLAEGLGNVFIEAQACGTPPIGTRVGGIPDIITNNENGLLIEPKNSKAITEAIIKLLTDKELTEKLSKQGLETVKKFSWQKIIKKIENIYQLKNNKKLKIIIATGIYPPDIGGPATFAKEIYNGFRHAGHKVKIVTFGEKESNNDFYFIKRQQSIFLRYFKYFLTVYRLYKWADVVYALDAISVGLPCALAKRLRSHKKFFIRLGGDYQWEQALACRRFKNTLRQFYKEKKFNFLEKLIYKLINFTIFSATATIFNSEFLRDVYIKEKNFPPSKGIVIKNIKKYFSKKEDIDEHRKYIIFLFAGRLVVARNLEILIKVFNRLTLPLRLEIIGEGPEKEKLRKEINKLRAGKKIKLLPAINHNDLEKKIKESDIIVIPSLTDVNPNFATEALASGKRVILTKESEAYFIGWRPDLIYYINPLDKNSITAGLYAAAKDALVVKKSNHVNLDRISWDIDKVINKHIEIFNEKNY